MAASRSMSIGVTTLAVANGWFECFLDDAKTRDDARANPYLDYIQRKVAGELDD